ncbi:DUF3570 domain-containing protein [Lacimicrobium alkaliphilum]|uniref:DUF3570 domain-containing protein n=1 Tax=Lacimicrobium alkaliphilum TaxID=1526571 RepID=A0ABQ1RFD3_9ALTE|nr:DUF3570 domain-containing protein [Lacimicrobium alkaliphilum]GGD68656.1 hypothetical protein GCM10011357_24660 [Lacimicrobium alkaliphilum]
MQLNQRNNILGALTAATCTLLGAPAVSQEAQSVEEPWKFDTAILYYGESERVTAVEGVFSATKDFGNEHIFNGKVTIDGLTGASATGAVPQPTAQTFTRPSGKDEYDIAATEIPLDDTFRDTRVQLNGQWTQPAWQDYRVSGGLHVSKEYDYLSMAVNGALAKDFNQRNTTVSLGLSYAFDSIDPEGGRPVAFASMPLKRDFASEQQYQDAFDATRLTGSDDKNTLDLLLGVTQVINRRTIMQLNYGVSAVDGYLTDPFKMLSVVNTQGLTQALVYENRPDNRTRHNVFWQTKYAMDSGVADISYRFTTDDWDIDSHTLDSRLRYNLSPNTYIQPHFRYYQQSAADFYQPYLMASDGLPQFASADYRVGEMTAFTLGVKYGVLLDQGKELAFRLEYYQQDPKNPGFDAPGVLQDLDLYPSVKAVMAQVSYRF